MQKHSRLLTSLDLGSSYRDPEHPLGVVLLMMLAIFTCSWLIHYQSFSCATTRKTVKQRHKHNEPLFLDSDLTERCVLSKKKDTGWVRQISSPQRTNNPMTLECLLHGPKSTTWITEKITARRVSYHKAGNLIEGISEEKRPGGQHKHEWTNGKETITFFHWKILQKVQKGNITEKKKREH